MNGEDGFQTLATARRSPRRRILLLLLLLLIFGISIFLGMRYFGPTKESEVADIVVTPSPTTQPTATPVATTSGTITPGTGRLSPSPTKGVATDTLTIEVLNGSGVAGAAKVMSDLLTSSGYTVSGTGNADSYDYETTTIQVKKSKSSALASLKAAIAKKYTVGTASATLAESTETDGVVIVGKE